MKQFASTVGTILLSLLLAHGVVLAQKTNNESKTSDREGASKQTNATASMKVVLAAYLQLEEALVNDKTKDAATAGTALESAFKKFDATGLTSDQEKLYADASDDAREHAEHIEANAGNIEHQREHFDLLSKDIYDLVKTIGADEVLYKIECPMANDGKGAYWVSRTKEIQNPYLGQSMPSCGMVQEEIK